MVTTDTTAPPHLGHLGCPNLHTLSLSSPERVGGGLSVCFSCGDVRHYCAAQAAHSHSHTLASPELVGGGCPGAHKAPPGAEKRRTANSLGRGDAESFARDLLRGAGPFLLCCSACAFQAAALLRYSYVGVRHKFSWIPTPQNAMLGATHGTLFVGFACLVEPATRFGCVELTQLENLGAALAARR